MRMRMVRRGGPVGLIAAALLVAGVPASAAPGDGSAFGASVSVTLLGSIGPITAGPFAMASTDGPNQDSLAKADVPGVLSAGVINTSATRDDSTGQVDSSASTADVQLTLLANTPVSAKLVEATCTATQSGVTGSSKLVDVKLGKPGSGLGDVDASPAPNTKVDVPNILSITFNEQIENGDGSLTVNAIHVRLLGGNLSSIGTGDVIISSARCGPAGLPVPLASGLGLWIGLGALGLATLPAAVALRRRSGHRIQSAATAA
jgi:hypothetical protein